MSSNPYIVRQFVFAFVAFVAVGSLFCVLGWFSIDIPILPRAFISSLGLLSIAAGLFGWKAGRVAVVADRNGIWCSGFSLLRKILVPWDCMINIKKVTWTSWEGEHEGVLIGIKENMPHPAGSKYAGVIKSELEKLIGEVACSNPLMLSHDEWDWQVDDFVAIASKCICDPHARKELGEYKRPAD